jgi:hypothetical protein
MTGMSWAMKAGRDAMELETSKNLAVLAGW